MCRLTETRALSAQGEKRALVGNLTMPCNRIALLHFLVKHGVDAHLTFVYFMGDRSDLGSDGRDCPANRQNWQDALDAQDHHVGVPADSPIRARIHRTFLPAYLAQI